MPQLASLSFFRNLRASPLARLFRCSESLTYDDSSLITADGTKASNYDGLKRLLSATPANTGSINQNTESYSYDKTGNRKTDTTNTIGTNYATNLLDQYTSQTGGVNKNYTYDANGNLKNDGTKSFVYDYQNRLVQVNQGTGVVVQYQYDVLGRRIQKTTPTETTIYIYAGDNIVQEIKNIGGLVLKKEYINGIGTDNLIAYDAQESTNQDKITFCQVRVLPYTSDFNTYGYSSIISDCNTTITSNTGVTTKRYFYHVNHLGSVIALSNGSGDVIQSYSYDSFGKAYVISGSGILTSVDSTSNLYGNSRLYTGREYDREINLYFLRARYYDASTGKFISRDPIGQRDQVNLYTYVANSPIMFVDRFGREKTLIIGFAGYQIPNGDFRTGEIPESEWTTMESLGLGVALETLRSSSRNKYDTKLYFSSAGESELDMALKYVKERKGKYNKLVIIGHSMGADDSVEFSQMLDKEEINVDLLATIDLQSVGVDSINVPDNVKKAVNYRQYHFFSPLPNGDELTGDENKVTNYLVNSRKGKELDHGTIDDAYALQILKTTSY